MIGWEKTMNNAYVTDFDFIGNFGFDFSSTVDFVYSTLSKKYAKEILRQKLYLSVYKDSYDRSQSVLIMLESEAPLKDFFNASELCIEFDKSQRVEQISLIYGFSSGMGMTITVEQMLNHFHAITEIRKMCKRIETFESEEEKFLYFSNCVVTDWSLLEEWRLVISWENKEE